MKKCTSLFVVLFVLVLVPYAQGYEPVKVKTVPSVQGYSSPGAYQSQPDIERRVQAIEKDNRYLRGEVKNVKSDIKKVKEEQTYMRNDLKNIRDWAVNFIRNVFNPTREVVNYTRDKGDKTANDLEDLAEKVLTKGVAFLYAIVMAIIFMGGVFYIVLFFERRREKKEKKARAEEYDEEAERLNGIAKKRAEEKRSKEEQSV